MKLTLNNAQASKPGDDLKDAKVTGLHLRVQATKKTFYLRYRYQGQRRHPAIGDWPAIGIEDARKIASEMLLELAKGNDPAIKKNADNDIMMPKLCELYMYHHGDKKKSGDKDQEMIDRFIIPSFKKRTVRSMVHMDILKLHEFLKDTPTQSNRLLALLSKMFNLAELWGYRDNYSNPCRHVKRYKEKKRKRYATREEVYAIAKILKRDFERYPNSVVFLMLLIFSGARKGEIAMAKPEWLTMLPNGCGKLQLPDSKTEEKDIIISRQGMEYLAKLPRYKSGTICGILDPKNYWRSVRVEAGCPDLRMHDLRHSFASVALSLGFSLGQIGELFDHASPDTTNRYAHLLDEKRSEMVDTVADEFEIMMAEKVQ